MEDVDVKAMGVMPRSEVMVDLWLKIHGYAIAHYSFYESFYGLSRV